MTEKGYGLKELWELYLESGGTPEEYSEFSKKERKKDMDRFCALTKQERINELKKDGIYFH